MAVPVGQISPCGLAFPQDTGLLYRAVGFKALKSSIAFDDVGTLVRLSNSLSPEDLKDPDLRGDEAAKAASQVSVRRPHASIKIYHPHMHDAFMSHLVIL